MYRCVSWTIKKAKCRRTDDSEFLVLEKTHDSPLESKEIKPDNPKGSQHWLLEGLLLKLKLQYLGHLMWTANSLEKIMMLGKIEGRRRGRQRMRRLDGIIDSVVESEQTPRESEGQGSLACCSPWGRRVGHNLVAEQQEVSFDCQLHWLLLFKKKCNSFIEIWLTYRIIDPFKVCNFMVFGIFIEMCNHQHNFKMFSSKWNPVPLSYHYFSIHCYATTNFLSPQISLFWTLHMNGMMQFIALWLASFT